MRLHQRLLIVVSCLMTAPDTARRARYLVISNGHGEDSIAAALVKRLVDTADVEAYPFIGLGNAYAGLCPIVGPRGHVATGGSRSTKGSLWHDISQGGLAIFPPAIKFLRRVRNRYDRIIVLGDTLIPTLALVSGLRDLFYIDVYKTGWTRGYSAAERFVLTRTCSKVLCRKDSLAEILRQSGIDALNAGNLMMDTIPYGDFDAPARRSKPLALLLLPGSRKEVQRNFVFYLALLNQLNRDLPDIFLAVAGGVSIPALGAVSGMSHTPPSGDERDDLGVLSDGLLKIHLLSGRALGNAIEASDIVLSESGTATTQAVGLGKPVISSRNPNGRPSRAREIAAYYGESRFYIPRDNKHFLDALRTVLDSPETRARMGELGRVRVGGPGAMETILKELGQSVSSAAPHPLVPGPGNSEAPAAYG